MAESLHIPKNASRKEIYEALIPQVQSLLQGETDEVAQMAILAAAIKEAFGFFWVGFYIAKEKELVLGTFQGSIACLRIAFNRGVCCSCSQKKQTVIVPDVDLFPGHIACSSASKSEIVVPLFSAKDPSKVAAVLDVDSDRLNDFSEVDQVGLEKLCGVLRLFNVG